MCFTLSQVTTTGRWNWEGDEIVYEPIVRNARKDPIDKQSYNIDIREFLLAKDNAVISNALSTILKRLPVEDRFRFISHSKGSFDYSVRVITSYFINHFRYIPGKRKFDYWLFPDETIARGGGDCEDRAFLLASLLLASGLSGYVVRVALGKLYNKQSRKSRDHVWVMYRNEDGRWMCLEPLLLTNDSKKKSISLSKILLKTTPCEIQYEYIPYFVFNDTHLWRIKSNKEFETFRDHIGRRKFWAKYNPEFATRVHNDIIDQTLSDLSYEDRFYMKAYSLGLDTVMSYDPRDHFDNGYITEGWALIQDRIKKKDLNNLTCIVHATADFYAHSSYAQFAPRDPNSNGIKLFSDEILSQLEVHYDVEPFNLSDVDRFTVNPYFFKDNTRNKAIWYCVDRKIISGRFAQKRDPYQGFLEKNFVQIPYSMRNAKDFSDRGCFPHHNEIAVDTPLEKDGSVPPDHRLYQVPNEYQKQFELRFDAAKRHIAKLYNDWKKEK